MNSNHLRFKGVQRQHEYVGRLGCWVSGEGVLLSVYLCPTGDLCFYDLQTGEILGVVLDLLPIPYL